MPAKKPLAVRRLPRPVRIIMARPRLFVAALVGLSVIAMTPDSWLLATRLLVGWDVGIGLYLLADYQLIASCDADHIRRRAAIADEGRVTILVLTVAAALASLGAIIALLGSTRAGGRDALQLALATLTILLSWAFIHTIFALHYAHEYYGEFGAKRRGASGLTFPNEAKPDYWDFVYFSFVIGMTSQVSDVAVASKPIRRTVAAHGIVSFLFNAALLALTVNIAASAM
jgi:uncharacterized membrane protein